MKYSMKEHRQGFATHNSYGSTKCQRHIPQEDYLFPLKEAMIGKIKCVDERINMDHSLEDIPNVKLCFDIDCKKDSGKAIVTLEDIPFIVKTIIDKVKDVYGMELEEEEVSVLKPFTTPFGLHIVVWPIVMPNDKILRKKVYDIFVNDLKSKWQEARGGELDVDRQILSGGLRMPFSKKTGLMDAYYPLDWETDNGIPKLAAHFLDEIEEYWKFYCIHTYEEEPTPIKIDIDVAEPVAKLAAQENMDLSAILSLFKDQTFDERLRCIRLIWATKALDDSESAFVTLDKQLRRSEKYWHDESWGRKVWDSFDESAGITSSTLYFLLKEDNPEGFAKICEQGLGGDWSPLAKLSWNPSDKGFADLFLLLTEETFVWERVEELFWFTKNGRWFKDDKRGSTIRGEMSKIIPSAIENFAKLAAPKIDDEKLRAKFKRNAKYAANKMRNDAPLKKAINMLKDIAVDPDFAEKINSNTMLLGFDDGVYDLAKHEFRAHQKEDYVSFSVGYSWQQAKKETVQEVMSLLGSFFKTSDDLDYVLSVLASFLDGENRAEEFYIFTGSGGNGKGVLFSFLEQVLGTQYFRWLNASYLTEVQRNAKGANPCMADKGGCRVLCSSEPEENQKIQTGNIKKLTGRDKEEARPLYAKQSFEFVPQFSLIFQTNDIPRLSAYDRGIERRIRIINFPFSFTDNPIGDNERKIDRSLKSDKIKRLDWRVAFMQILLDCRKRLGGILPQSENSALATKEYLWDNNPGMRVLEHFLVTGDVNDKVSCMEIVTWMRKNMPDEETNPRKVVSMMENNGIRTKRTKNGKVAIGLKMISDEIWTDLTNATDGGETNLDEIDMGNFNLGQWLEVARRFFPGLQEKDGKINITLQGESLVEN